MKFSLCNKDTEVIIGKNIISNNIPLHRKYFLVYSEGLEKLISNTILSKFKSYKVPNGEASKEMNYAIAILKEILDYDFTRNDGIIALGGGTVSDLAGFVSSIYMRGTYLINIPTTLLAMVDASIGGKNGLNFYGYKNIIGSFYQPNLILEDIDFLKTLPKEEIMNGLGEIIKYAMMLDKEFYYYLLNEKDNIINYGENQLSYIISRSVYHKMSIVKEDEIETKGLRTILNFGHTIGHAIESASLFKVKHGYAISYGMLCETKIGVDNNLISEDVLSYLEDILRSFDYNFNSIEIDKEIAIKAIKHDKKKQGNKIMLPLPAKVGSWKIFHVDLDLLEKGLNLCLKN
ncbi:MAG: 3-dehydroquinate synthase [Caldisphaera sp.]|jgi:3-dehydroquinate synthase|nr:MAG: 3-dehydroquinate synthase [Caldisphaera sp.]